MRLKSTDSYDQLINKATKNPALKDLKRYIAVREVVGLRVRVFSSKNTLGSLLCIIGTLPFVVKCKMTFFTWILGGP